MDVLLSLLLVISLAQALPAAQDGAIGAELGTPDIADPAMPSSSRVASVAPALHRRQKRCSCSSYMDKECIYFCHLDIIWINTPEKVVPYGLATSHRAKRGAPAQGPPRVRTRGKRCACAAHGRDDSKCANFCAGTAAPPAPRSSEPARLHRVLQRLLEATRRGRLTGPGGPAADCTTTVCQR
uniref:Endothelin A n=1 Tax=Petromyzon marinus TaxID=7757 RepID=A0A1D6Y8M3_PETMA|nr:endothelin-1-like [Petromyzon marinus]AME28950.1 endothelin A [Petromyzon marinus]